MCLRGICCGYLLVLIGSAAFAADPMRGVRANTDIIVTSFGAKGDGETDDTEALQRAADALAELNGDGIEPFYRARRQSDMRKRLDRHQPRLVFPKGIYRISSPVFFRNKVFAVGEEAQIVQSDASADAFYVHAAFVCRVSGFSFKGGRSHLRFATHNTECANIRVSDCSFAGSSDAAIECKSFRLDGKGDRKKLALGEWKWNSETGRYERDPRWEEKKLVYNNSTFFLIENCMFEDCRRAADVNPDGGMIRDCSVRTISTAEGGAFRLADVMHVMRVNIFIRRNPVAVQSAFELYNDMVSGGMIDFWAEDSSLQTDDGRGAPFVSCCLDHQGYVASSIVLENIQTETPDGAGVIEIAKGPPPSIAACLRVWERSGRQVPMLSSDSDMTEQMLLEGSPAGASGIVSLQDAYSFALSDCDGVLPPTGLLSRFMQVCPKEVGQEPFPEPRGSPYGGEVHFAVDDGVDMDFETDDTDALRRFFARLAAKDGSVGVLPGAMLRVNGTLPLRGRFCIVGAGVSVFETQDDSFPVFGADPGAEVLIRDVQVRGGRSHVIVPDGATVRLEGCFLYDPREVTALVNHGGRFSMDGCVVYASHLYCGAGEGFLATTWFRYLSPHGPNKPMSPSVAIFNRGRLQAWDILGVPCIYSRYKWNNMGKADDVPDEVRWVDNFGLYYSRGFRYGGEWGGVTPVYHYGDAETAMEGSYAWFETFRTLRTPILSDVAKPNARCFAVSFSANKNVVPEIAFLWRAMPGSVVQKVPSACLNCVYPSPKGGRP